MPAARRIARRRIPRWGHIVLGAVIVAAVLFAFAHSTLAVYRVEREAAEYDARLTALRRRNAQLREEIRRLGVPATIERIAREELGLVRPGEIAILLIPEDPPPAPPPTRRPPDGALQRLARWWRGLRGEP